MTYKISLTPSLHRRGDLKRGAIVLVNQRMLSNETDTKHGSDLLGKIAERIRKKRKIGTMEAYDVSTGI